MAGPKRNALQNIFYKEATDGEFKFNNGKTIKINKALLGSKHDTFYEIFFKGTQNIVEINDFDSDTFKLFLDCFMGFKQCTETDALLILPIAVKYQIDEFIEKLVEILKPKELNEVLCISLNLAIFYNMTKFTDLLLNFLHEEFKHNQLLDMDNLCFLLEPESVLVLLNYIEMDSWVYTILFKWGNNYMKKNNKAISLREFFEECKIMDKITLDSFETVESVFKFTESDLGSNFFTDREILDHLRKNIYSEKKSEWIKIKDGDKIEEVFTVKDLYLPKDYSVNLFFKRNNVVFYGLPITKNVSHLIDYEITWKYTDDKSFEDLNYSPPFNAEDLSESFNSEYFSIKIKDFGEEYLLKEIRITYTFNADCRILKKSAKFNMQVHFEKGLLHFTDDIYHKMEKKVKTEEVKPKEEAGNSQKEADAARPFWNIWGPKPTPPTPSTTPSSPMTNINLRDYKGPTVYIDGKPQPRPQTNVVWKIKPKSPLAKAIQDIKRDV